jgi:hypothetical protein
MLIAILHSFSRGLRRPWKVYLGVAVLFLALVSGAGGSRRVEAAYTFGVENSWIRVQNIGQADATVEVDYYDENGILAGRDICPTPGVCPSLAPGSGWTFFTRDNPTLPPGFKGSAVITTDQPIAAILAKDVIRGDAFLIAGDSVTVGAGSHRLYLPLVSNQDGPYSDWNGRFVIENLSDTTTACLTITYLSNYTARRSHGGAPARLPSGRDAAAAPRQHLPRPRQHGCRTWLHGFGPH